MTWTPLMTAALACATLVLPATAHAQASPEERAGALVDEANQHYYVGEYAEAIAAYQAAYELVPEPLLLWNLGQAYRLAGDCASALTYYTSYVRDAPAGEFRDKADQRIPEMEACAETQATAPDTGPATDPATPTDPDVATGTVTDPRAASVDPTPPEVPAPAGSRRRKNLRLAGLATIGAGAVGLLAGGYYSWRSSGYADDAEALCATLCAGPELAAVARKGDAADRNAIIFYVAGGVAVTAGIAITWLARSRGERRASVALVPTGGGAMASAGWSF